jgi:DNA polymerase-3 subunit delta
MRPSPDRKPVSFQETLRGVRHLYEQIQAGVVAPVYLFYGEEAYLREQVARNVAYRLVPEADRLTNLQLLEGSEVSLESFLRQLQSTGFNFGDTVRQVVWVRRVPWFTPRGGGAMEESGMAGEIEENDLPEREDKAASAPPAVSDSRSQQAPGSTEALYRRLEQGLPQDLTLIFTVAGSLDKRLRLFKLIDRIGFTLEFPPLKSDRDVADFVQLKLAGERVRIDPEALHELTLRLGLEAQLLANELNKLVTYVAERRHITRADVVAAVAPTAELSVFELVDAVAERKTAAALEQLDGMLLQHAQPFLILGMLMRQFRLLLQARYLLDRNLLPRSLWQQDAFRFSQALNDTSQGPSPLQQAQEATASCFPQTGRTNLLRQHYFPLWKTLRQAESFTTPQLQAALERLLQADLSLKTSHLPEDQVLELLVVDLCERLDAGATVDWEDLLEGG